MKAAALWILKIAISAAFLGALWYLIDFSALRQQLPLMRWIMLVPIAIFLIASIALRAARFLLVFNSPKHSMNFLDAFNLSLVGETLNMILPGAMGDLGKAYYGYRRHRVKEEMISATVLDKLTALLGLAVLGVAASATLQLWGFCALFLALTCMLGSLLYIPHLIPWRALKWLQTKMRADYLNVGALSQSFSATGYLKTNATLISIVGWIASFVTLYFITRLFALEVSLLFLCVVAPLITLSKLFPLTWSGLGVQEGVTAYLFAMAGIAPAIAVAVSLVYTIITTVLPGFVGLAVIFSWKD